MITITEYTNFTVIANDQGETNVVRGTSVPQFTGNDFVLWKGRLGQPNAKHPIFKVSKVGQLGTITDKDGSTLTITTLEQFAKDVASFFL